MSESWKDPSISIVIVNYNGGHLLESCIASLIESISVSYEIIVVDNASSDGSTDFLPALAISHPHVSLIANQQNVGFAVANNAGASYAKGTYIHFLNPDTLASIELDNCYRDILNKEPSLRAFVTGLREEDGSIAKSNYLIPTLRNYVEAMFRTGNVAYWWLGASVILSKTQFHQVGGWPTDYFMYSEDLDLFYRLNISGFNVQRLDCSVSHHGKGSTRTVWSEIERSIRIERSAQRFYAKYNMMADYYLLLPFQFLHQFIASPYKAILRLRAVLLAIREK